MVIMNEQLQQFARGTLSNVITTANEINESHKLARSSAETAIMYAIRCGELLTAQKARLKHGEWKPWVEANCEFSYRQGAKYMQAAKSASQGTFSFSSLNEALGYESKPHVSNNSGENEWYTPECFTESARNVMGSIDTDPASSDLANESVKAETFFTAEENGLKQEWKGNVWMNPPYSQPEIQHFADALTEKVKSGEIKNACVLVNNATDTAWFQSLLSVCGAVCFLKGRVKFIDKNGEPSGAPLQGQAIIYYGEDLIEFVKEFNQYGTILQ